MNFIKLIDNKVFDGKPVELYFAREDIWNKFLNN